MLVLDNVDAHYGKSHVLHGVSIEVRAGEVVGLLGRNGVGKTTTLKAIMGMARRTGGRITFEGRDLHGVPPHGLAGLGIAWVPEERRIFRLLTVLENLRTGLDRPGITPARRDGLLEKVYAYFPILKERRNQAGGTLSGGEQQMLAIARAMMLEPKIILLVPLTLDAAGRVYIMEKGAVRHHASSAELRADPRVIHEYLGV